MNTNETHLVGTHSFIIKMHGLPNIKFASAEQAKETLRYNSIRHKLHKTTAAIWFNKICRQKHIAPNYISIRINGRKRQDMNTLRTATHYRLNQEIKFLYCKKAILNEQLYHKHLECARLWPGCWPNIQDIIDQNLQSKFELQYNYLNKKLDHLQTSPKNDSKYKDRRNYSPPQPRTFHLTNIQFTDEKLALLPKGLQHSLHIPTATAWTNLALETERAIRLLYGKDQPAYRTTATKKLKQIINAKHTNIAHKRHYHLIKQINTKITEGEALITKADKGKISHHTGKRL
jgi:hypothetical protein